jgi:hypothetical protein
LINLRSETEKPILDGEEEKRRFGRNLKVLLGRAGI